NPPATHGPRSPPLSRPSYLSNRDLFFSRRQIRSCSIPQTAASLPGVLIKLNATVKTIAGIDCPITSGFAFRQRIPCAAISYRRNFRSRLGADAENPVAGRRDDDISYWQPAGLDTVDRRDGERDVL